MALQDKTACFKLGEIPNNQRIFSEACGFLLACMIAEDHWSLPSLCYKQALYSGNCDHCHAVTHCMKEHCAVWVLELPHNDGIKVLWYPCISLHIAELWSSHSQYPMHFLTELSPMGWRASNANCIVSYWKCSQWHWWWMNLMTSGATNNNAPSATILHILWDSMDVSKLQTWWKLQKTRDCQSIYVFWVLSHSTWCFLCIVIASFQMMDTVSKKFRKIDAIQEMDYQSGGVWESWVLRCIVHIVEPWELVTSSVKVTLCVLIPWCHFWWLGVVMMPHTVVALH